MRQQVLILIEDLIPRNVALVPDPSDCEVIYAVVARNRHDEGRHYQMVVFRWMQLQIEHTRRGRSVCFSDVGAPSDGAFRGVWVWAAAGVPPEVLGMVVEISVRTISISAEQAALVDTVIIGRLVEFKVSGNGIAVCYCRLR